MPPTRKPCLSSRTVIDAKEAFEQAETVGKTEPTVVFTEGISGK